MIKSISFVFCSFVLISTGWAHSGGTDASGCHHDRQNGGYHCHSPKLNPAESRSPNSTEEMVVFNQKTHKIHRPNCKSALSCTVNCVTIKKSDALERGGVACGNCGG